MSRIAGLTPSLASCPVCRTYRGFYIINWVYRFFTEPHYRQWLVWISGVVQTG